MHLKRRLKSGRIRCVFRLRPPRHPSTNALAGFGLPLHNLASAFTVIVCLGILFTPGRTDTVGAPQAMLEAVYGRQAIRREGLALEKLRRLTSGVTKLLGQTLRITRHDRKSFRSGP
jgi:hypothetical protein